MTATGGEARLSWEQLAEWVSASCVAQGVPVFVTDPTVLGRVGSLLGGRPGAPARRASTEEAPGRRLQAPTDVDAGRVEVPDAGGGRVDRDVVDDRANDRDLAGEIQIGPLLS
jgi:hypothetical protein